MKLATVRMVTHPLLPTTVQHHPLVSKAAAEQNVARQFRSYLEEFSIIPKEQFARRQHHSTEDALVSVHAHGACSGPNRTPAPPLIFLGGNGSRGFFCLAQLQFFLVAFLCSRLQNYQGETLCCCAELPAKRMDSARGSDWYWLRHFISIRGEQLIPEDDRKEETSLPNSFSP